MLISAEIYMKNRNFLESNLNSLSSVWINQQFLAPWKEQSSQLDNHDIFLCCLVLLLKYLWSYWKLFVVIWSNIHIHIWLFLCLYVYPFFWLIKCNITSRSVSVSFAYNLFLNSRSYSLNTLFISLSFPTSFVLHLISHCHISLRPSYLLSIVICSLQLQFRRPQHMPLATAAVSIVAGFVGIYIYFYMHSIIIGVAISLTAATSLCRSDLMVGLDFYPLISAAIEAVE